MARVAAMDPGYLTAGSWRVARGRPLRWLWLGLGACLWLLLAPPAGAQIAPTPRKKATRAETPAQIGPPASVEPIATQHSAWQLLWQDFDRDGRDEIAYTSHSGRLTVQQLDGTVLWSRDLGAFTYALASCDLDRDGKLEILATAAGEGLQVFGHDGAPRFRHASDEELEALACGRFGPQGAWRVAVAGGAREISLLDATGRLAGRIPYPLASAPAAQARVLAAGDVDGDSDDELLVAHLMQHIALVEPPSGGTRWRVQATKRASRWLYAAGLWDLDRDGAPEIVVGSRSQLSVFDRDGKRRFDEVPARDRAGFRMVLPVPVDLDGDGRLEIATLYGSELQVFDRTGRRVYAASTSSLYLNAIAPSPQPSNQVMLGSITGSDRNVYRVRFGVGTRDELQALADPPGHRRQIVDGLMQTRKDVLARPADPRAAGKRYTVSLGGLRAVEKVLRRGQREQAQYTAAYPYANIAFYHNVTLRTEESHRKKAVVASEQVPKLAKQVEAMGLRHVVDVGHSLDSPVSLASIRAWLENTPKTCIGIRISEFRIEQGLLPAADLPGYRVGKVLPHLDAFILPAIDLAASFGKPTYLLSKENFWINAAAAEKARARLFTPARRRAIVATVEGSRSVAPENNLMARVGLWRSGLVPRWAVRIINDNLRTSKSFEYQASDPDTTLRHLVAYAAAGASDFDYKARWVLRDRRGLFDHAVGHGIRYNTNGLLSFDLFLHLLGKGLLDVPEPDELVGLSPVALAFREPSRQFLKASASMPSPASAFTGHDVALARAHPAYLNGALLGVSHYGLDFVPATPYGLPAVVPAWLEAKATPWARQRIETDGETLWLDGSAKRGEAARDAVTRAFADAAETLPLRASDVFWMATRRPGGTLRLTLVDPDYLEPAARTARVVTSRPIESLRDVVSGRRLAHEPRSARIEVPAGGFRIVDVELTGESPSEASAGGDR